MMDWFILGEKAQMELLVFHRLATNFLRLTFNFQIKNLCILNKFLVDLNTQLSLMMKVEFTLVDMEKLVN